MDYIENDKDKSFEDIKHTDENGNEFWFACELQIALDYKNGKSL